MSTVGADGAPWCHYTRVDGQGGGYGTLARPGERRGLPEHDPLPDPDDPATLGWLVKFVREAWPNGRLLIWEFDARVLRWGVRIESRGHHQAGEKTLFYVRTETLGEGLAAALRAAGMPDGDGG